MENILLIIGLAFPIFMGIKFAAKGKRLSKAMAKCHYCRSDIPADASVCPYCRRSEPVDARSGIGTMANTPGVRFGMGLFIGIVLELVVAGVFASIF